MKQYRPTYFIGQALAGIWRNGVMSFASIAVLMSCLVVLGSFSLLVANIDVNLEDLGLMNQIVVFVKKETPEAGIKEMEREIKRIPYVGEVTRVTAAEALEQMKEQAGDEGYLYDMVQDDNPLLDSFILEYVDGAHYSDIMYNLGQLDGVDSIRDQRSLANTMQSLKNGIMLVFSWFLIVLFVVSIFVIINTVKLSVYSRKAEISIMRYVGATGLFIATPFVIEGALIGLTSSMLAFIVEYFLYGYVQNSMGKAIEIIRLIPLSEVSVPVFFAFAAVGVLTGIVGSTISLSKYTRD